MDETPSSRLSPLSWLATVRALLSREPLVKQSDAIQVVENKVPVRPVIPRVAHPPEHTDIPLDWNMVYLGPGRPPVPMWNQSYYVGRLRVDNIDPRSIEYPPNVNATIQPRIGYGLMPFADIEAYAHIPPVAKCRRMIIDEIRSLEPQILDKDGNVVSDPDLAWMTTYPDRTRPWSSWLSKFLYNSIVFDAPAVQPIYSSDGKIMATRVIEGPTIFVMIDEHGEQPATPAPAFAQIIWGTQFIWLNSDQLWYYPRNLRSNAPYGITAIEECLQPIQTIANMWNYSLAWYTEGTTPEDSMAMPQDFTVDQVREWQNYEDGELAGNAKLRRRRRYYPYGVNVVATKNATFDKETYDTAVEEISLMHGIPPAEFGKMPSQGLGGKGMSQNKTTQFYRLAIEPNVKPIIDLMNRVLAYNGYEGYTFGMNYPTTSIDPTEEHQNVLDEFEGGITMRDEARGKLGHTKLGGEAGQLMVDPNKQKSPEDAGISESKVKVNPGTSAVRVSDSKIPVNTSQVHVRSGGSNRDKIIVKQGDGSLHSWPRPNGQSLWPIVDELLKENTTVKYADNILTGETYPILVKAEEVTHSDDGGMIALFLPNDVAERLAGIAYEKFTALSTAARIEAAENLHVSLAVFDKLEQNTKTLAAMQITAMAFTTKQLIGRIGGYGVFNNGKEQVVYASLDAPELPALRQTLCEQLEALGIDYLKEHGFTPHITLAYIPSDVKFTGIDIPEIDVAIDGLTLAEGEYDKITITFHEGYTRMGKMNRHEHLREDTQSSPTGMATADESSHPTKAVESPYGDDRPMALYQNPSDEMLARVINQAVFVKHCGVCPEDAEYFGQPVSRAMTVDFPHQGANATEIVAISPPAVLGLPSVPAIWKPESGEDTSLNANIGGPQFVREEAAWLFDQAFTDDEHHLVPVAYVTELDGENGVVLYYSKEHGEAQEVEKYALEWIELAAIEDYVLGQTDRGGHNWLTHADDSKRPLLIDWGLSLPAPDSPRNILSAFVTAQGDKPLSSDNLKMLEMVCKDKSLWSDIEDIVGKPAMLSAWQRAREICDRGVIPSTVTEVSMDES